MKHATGEGSSVTRDDFDSLHRLQGPDHAGKGANDTRFLSGRNSPRRRRIREKAAVAGRGKAGIKDRQLSLELMNRSRYKGLSKEPCGVCHKKTRWEIVRSIQNEVVAPEQLRHIVFLKSVGMDLQSDVGVQF